MTPERRSKYADYLSDAWRYAAKETGLSWPEDTIFVAKTYCDLAEIDDILGAKVYVMDMPSSYDFFVAFQSRNEGAYSLQKAFLEYLELYSMEG